MADYKISKSDAALLRKRKQAADQAVIIAQGSQLVAATAQEAFNDCLITVANNAGIPDGTDLGVFKLEQRGDDHLLILEDKKPT